jgi:hypothetical protein
MSDDVRWRKSSYSGQGANCVEVAQLRDATAVRDSKNPDGPVLTFPADAWGAFVAGVKSGRARPGLVQP